MMVMKFTAQIPEALLHLLGAPHSSSTELSDRITEELVVSLYAQEKISLGKAAAILELDRWAFETLLQKRGLDTPYGMDDLDADLKFAGHLIETAAADIAERK